MNPIDNVEPFLDTLRHLVKLEKLRLGGNQIDVNPIAKLLNLSLRSLDLSLTKWTPLWVALKAL